MTVAISESRSLATGGDPDELFPVPADELFVCSDFLPDPQLDAIASALIEQESLFRHLRGQPPKLLWKRNGGTARGKDVFGRTVRPTGLMRHFCDAPFVIWLAADYCRDHCMTRWEIGALVFHELCHTGVDDETLKLKLIDHDFEGFVAELRRYGAWHQDLRGAARSFQQLRLVDA